jgi:hypothetical protein
MSLSTRQTLIAARPVSAVHSRYVAEPVGNKPAAPDSSFPFTAVAATNLITSAAHGLSAGVRVRVSSTAALPAGLAAATDYFVIASGLASNDFKLSATLGGGEVDITDAGTGTHSWQRYLTAPELSELTAWIAYRYPPPSQGGDTRIFIPEPDPSSFVVTIYPATNLFGLAAHGLIAGSRVRFKSNMALPAPLVAGTDYYVIASGLTADVFKVSATVGGSEIDITQVAYGAPRVVLTSLQVLSLQEAYLDYHESPSFQNWWMDNFLSAEAQFATRKADLTLASEDTVSPSATNTGVGSGAVSAPVPAAVPQCERVDFEIIGGTIGSTISVKLTCATPASVIHYKKNAGATTTYAGPVVLNTGDDIEYWATSDGYTDSESDLFDNA